jgi:colanic acid/amylovoran biosynthesis glycosyltransferase
MFFHNEEKMQKKMLPLFSLLFFFTASFSTQTRRPLKVLFWLNSFPSKTGGSSFNQIVGFIKASHDVTILAQYSDYNQVHSASSELVKYNMLSKLFIKTLPKEKTEFDIIFCQSANQALPLLAFKNKNNIKGKLIVFVRGADLKIFQDQVSRKKIFDAFDLIAPVCEYFKTELVKLHQNNGKIKVFHSSINCKKFGYRGLLLPEKKTLSIITTSRLAHKKGLDYAIKAIALLVKIYPYLKYYIIGDGRSKEALQNLIDSLNLTQNIFLLGWKSSTEVIKLLNEGHIFILPSVTRNAQQEGIPNAVKEAMAIGLPVVSTYHAGIPELVEDGITGFLVPEKDSMALAKKIDFLIHHPESWENIIATARKFVEKHFERDAENKKLIEVCYELIEQSNPSTMSLRSL